MKLRMLEAAAGWRSLLLATLIYPSAIHAADSISPTVTANKFDERPMNVQYFKDSDTVLFQDFVANTIYRSENAGETWHVIKEIPMGDGWDLWMHPVDPKRAYVITRSSKHYMTSDRGKSWKTFDTGLSPSMFRVPLTYHASEPDKILFNGMDCQNILWCTEETKYTSDGFATPAKHLRSDTAGCYWAKDQELFKSGSSKIDEHRILCIVKGKYSPFRKDYRVLMSDDYFVNEHEPNMEPGRTVNGIGNLAMVKKYVVAAVSSTGTDEMALYVSDDTVTWHRAIFPKDHKLEEDAYTILESSYYSLQVDVMTSRPSNPMGVLFSSNSNGTFFTRNIEHTDRNFFGLVDFEKVSSVQGIFLVNTVDNWREVEKDFMANKKVQSQITFDDGRTFEQLTVDGERLHLHSVTDLDNSGKVFTNQAPGIMMGIGNTGEHLRFRDDPITHTYVSDDAGRTWKQALRGPHKYEFGDEGSILLAIQDGELTNQMAYSLNHGKTWNYFKLPKEIMPQELTTTFDAASQKFILVGLAKSPKKDEHYIMSIDFSKVNERTCTSGDMEEWYARVDENKNPTCLMGHKTSFLRRKADADCFVRGKLEEPRPVLEPCECTDQDFECDYNFIKNEEGECIKDGPLVPPAGACTGFGSDNDPGFKGSSGKRLIPGNDCKRTSGPQPDDPKQWKCSDANVKPPSGKIEKTQVVFKDENGGWKRKAYLERSDSSSGDDETIIMQTDDGKIHLTRDHGKNWEEILENAHITTIITNPYFNDVVYFLTQGTTVWYSTDRGNNIRKFEASVAPHREKRPGLPVMTFHPRHKDWFIWTGARDCEGSRSADCHAVAQLTKDRGDHWETIARYVRRCEFIYNELPTIKDGHKDESREKLIYCEVRSKESPSDVDNPWKLIGSADFFEEDQTTYFEDIVDFATMNEFIVVATRDETKKFLKASASMDGWNFAPANFPSNFKVEHEQAYTVLDSHTHAVFMHVTVSDDMDFQYGSILKSNSNGTNYVKIIDGVNRDPAGYVDFEKMHGLEGVALVNQVANYQEDPDHDRMKHLKSLITHNDGAEWTFLKPPATDVDGKPFNCSGPLEKCSLNIHSYTEREDKSRIFSSQTAVGILFGIGNVGEFLGKRSEADTFISRDAGVTWEMVKKGSYMWKFGDQGSIMVLVDPKRDTNVLYWSKDEGRVWEEYQFSDEKMRVDDLTTTPSDNSRNFLLWSNGPSGRGTVTINIDFTGLTSRQCTLDEDKENNDYYFWSPKHPTQKDDCLFGHISQYHRKRIEADCYQGPTIKPLHDIAQNCSCTRADFECDFNFERKGDGSCELVEGLKPKTHKEQCALHPELTEYYESTGYRRIPLSTCEKGNELEYLGRVHPCPGKEEEFQKKHGIGPWGIFFAVMIPLGAAAGVGYYIWSNWANKFGQIRLGEQASFDDEAPFIKYPIMALSALFAIAQALPLLAASLWRSVSNAFSSRGGGARGRFSAVPGLGGGDRRFTTRDSFSRGRGDYAVADEDEGELLGEESDEEV